MAFKFAILADTHLSDILETAQYAIWKRMLETLKREMPDLVILLGDLTACGNLEVAGKALSDLNSLGIPLQIVYGNSDERTENTADEIRQYLLSPQPFVDSKAAVKLLELQAGKISPEEIAELWQFIEINQNKQIVIGCHYPPESFSGIPEMQKIFQSGKIDMFLCAHLHYERDYVYEETNVHVVRGLDPDKAIGGPAAISMAQYDTGWSFSPIELDECCGQNWDTQQKKDFFGLIGISTMDQPLVGFDLAIKNNIQNVELRYAHCRNIDREKLKLAAEKWRNNNGKNLSLHMPDLIFSSSGVFQDDEQWHDAVDMAIDLSADRVTIHVPRIENYVMRQPVLRETVIEKYLDCLEPLLAEDVQVGVENLHMNLGELDDGQRGFGYTPEECIDFIEKLRKKTRNYGIGLCLDIGHARNNPPYSSRISLSQWYAMTGYLVNAMHLHQVVQKTEGLENHYPIVDIFGPIISLQSLMWSWSVRQIPSSPMFLEIRDFSKTLQSFNAIKDYLFTSSAEELQSTLPQLGISVSTVVDTVTPEALDILLQYSHGPLEINPLLFPAQKAVEMFDSWRKENGIDIASLHVPFGDSYDVSAVDESIRCTAIKNVAAAIEMANEFDAELIILHASFEPVDNSERTLRIQQLRKSMDDLAATLKQNNCRLAIEYLPRTCIGNSMDEFDAILKNKSSELFGVCLDTNHLMADYEKLSTIILQLNERLFSLHISDYDGVDEKHWLPGQGIVDWQKFIASLKSIDYRGPWIYECKLAEGSLAEKLVKIKGSQQWLAEMVRKICQ